MNKKSKRIRPKSKRSRPAKTGSRPASTVVSTKLCSLTNPFCPTARGQRWPDGNVGQSLPTTIEGKIPIVANAAGNYAILLTPNWFYWTTTVDVGTGVITLVEDSPYDGYNNWFNVASEYRLVSGGVQVVATMPTMTASGLLRVIEIPSTESVSSLANLNAYGYMYPKVVEKPIRESGNITGVFAPGGPESRNFDRLGSNVQSRDTNDWTSLLVCCTGAPPGTTVGYIHYVLHHELKFAANSVFNTLSKSHVKADPMLTTGSNWLLDKVTTIVDGSKKEFEQQVKSHAENVAKEFLRGAFGSLPFPFNQAGNLALAVI